jgi:hypothetical protein
MRAVLIWLGVGSVALAAAIAVVAIFTGGSALAGAERLIASALLVATFAVVTLLCVIAMDRGAARWLMVSGVAAAAIALACWLLVVWSAAVGPGGFNVGTPWLMKPAVTVTLVAAGIAHAGLMLIPSALTERTRVCRTGTLTLGAIFAIGAIAILWAERFEQTEGQFLAVVLVLATFGTIATPALAFADSIRRRNEAGAEPLDLEVEARCPRCGTLDRRRPGPRRCEGCGLKMEIRIEEPRCACGYLRYHLKEGACPECGRKWGQLPISVAPTESPLSGAERDGNR